MNSENWEYSMQFKFKFCYDSSAQFKLENLVVKETTCTILYNFSFLVAQKKEIHTDLEKHDINNK